MLFFNEDELQNIVGPHVASNVRYIAFSLGMGPYLYLAFNENELLTHTLASKVRYFHVTPLQRRRLSSQQPQAALKLGRAASKVRYFHVTPHPSFDYRASSRRLR